MVDGLSLTAVVPTAPSDFLSKKIPGFDFIFWVQGYLAHKKTTSPTTLPQAYAQDSRGSQGGGAFPYGRGTPVLSWLFRTRFARVPEFQKPSPSSPLSKRAHNYRKSSTVGRWIIHTFEVPHIFLWVLYIFNELIKGEHPALP